MPTFEDYYNDVIGSAADLTEDEKATMKALMEKSPTVAGKVLAYERKDVLETEKKQFQDQFMATNQPIVDQANEIITKYRAGALETPAQVRTPAPTPQPQPRREEVVDPDIITKKILEAVDDRLNQHSNATLGIMNHTWVMQANYHSLFPTEQIPANLFDEVQKVAIAKGVSLDTAFNMHIAPKLEKKRADEVEARVAAAREEGAREATTRLMSTRGTDFGDGNTTYRIEDERPLNSHREVPENFRKMSESERKDLALKSFTADWEKSKNWTDEAAFSH